LIVLPLTDSNNQHFILIIFNFYFYIAGVYVFSILDLAIAGVFSRDAILKGSFDKYVESRKGKKGTTEVDTAFLQEIERWRELLARNIALRNPGLLERELNFAIQQTIDRIVFLRICEDRGIENYGQAG